MTEIDDSIGEKKEEERRDVVQDIVVTPQVLTPSIWTMITKVAPVMAASAMFGVTPEKAMAVMVKGHELGLGLAASFDFIHVIQGKPSLSSMGALALVYNHPEYEGIEIVEEERNNSPWSCSVTMMRTNGFEHTVTFTLDDAERAGLIKKKSGWEKYPANMLRWRAIGYCADLVFPDALGGLRRAEEFGADITPGGEVVDGSWEGVEDVVIERQSIQPISTKREGDKLMRAAIVRDSLPLDSAAEDIVWKVAEELGIPVPVARQLVKQLPVPESQKISETASLAAYVRDNMSLDATEEQIVQAVEYDVSIPQAVARQLVKQLPERVF